jgi:hypothetical protein
MRGVVLQLDPQSLDEDPYIVPFVTVGRPPHAVEERAIVHHFVLVPSELSQQKILRRREPDFLVAA